MQQLPKLRVPYLLSQKGEKDETKNVGLMSKLPAVAVAVACASAAPGAAPATLVLHLHPKNKQTGAPVKAESVASVFNDHGKSREFKSKQGNDRPQMNILTKLASGEALAASPAPDHQAPNSSLVCNGLLAACLTAWSYHTPLALSPTLLWLTLMQSVGTAFREDPSAYADVLLHDPSAGGARQRVEIHGSPEETKRALAGDLDFWSALFSQFNSMVATVVKPDAMAALQASFSGTTPTETLAMSVTALSCVQSYVEFRYFTRCALVSLELQGAVEDWDLLCDKIESLTTAFGPTFGEKYGPFIRDAHGSACRLRDLRRAASSTVEDEETAKWLQSIVAKRDMSGCSFIQGWILDFVWFDSEQELVGGPEPSTRANSLEALVKKSASKRLNCARIPAGFCTMPLTWEHETDAFTLFAGCCHLVTTPAGSLTTAASWAVFDCPPDTFCDSSDGSDDSDDVEDDSTLDISRMLQQFHKRTAAQTAASLARAPCVASEEFYEVNDTAGHEGWSSSSSSSSSSAPDHGNGLGHGGAFGGPSSTRVFTPSTWATGFDSWTYGGHLKKF